MEALYACSRQSDGRTDPTAVGTDSKQLLPVSVRVMLEFTKMFFHTLVSRKCLLFPFLWPSKWICSIALSRSRFLSFWDSVWSRDDCAIIEWTHDANWKLFCTSFSLVLTRFQFRSVCATASETSFHELFTAIGWSLRSKVFQEEILNDLIDWLSR